MTVLLAPAVDRTAEVFVREYVRSQGRTLTSDQVNNLAAYYRYVWPEVTDARLRAGGEFDVTEIRAYIGVCSGLEQGLVVARQEGTVAGCPVTVFYAATDSLRGSRACTGGGLIVVVLNRVRGPEVEHGPGVERVIHQARLYLHHELMHVYLAPATHRGETTLYARRMLRRVGVEEGSPAAWKSLQEIGPYLASLVHSTSPGETVLRPLYRHFLEGFDLDPELDLADAPPALTFGGLTSTGSPVVPATRTAGMANSGASDPDPIEGPADATAQAGRAILLRLLEEFGPRHGFTKSVQLPALLQRVSEDEIRNWGREEFERCFGPLPDLAWELPPEVVDWLKGSVGIEVGQPRPPRAEPRPNGRR